MRDDRKDQIEDIGGAVLEAAISLVPIVGGPTAVLTNRILGSAVQRRQARILVELRDDLTRLQDSGLVVFDEALAESEPFQASLQRIIRQLLESDSDDKRTLLRNALLNRTIGVDDPGRFDEALDRVQAGDVVLLAEIADDVLAYGLISTVPEAWAESEDLIRSERTKRLLRLGLIQDLQDPVGEMKHILDAAAQGRPASHSTTSKHGVSPLGRSFLAYVADPIVSPVPPTTPATSDLR
ncbi:hypothetical protein [Curtobacterium sp. 20TX0008]|uniref:hypothetical protein n=1 Tax=Curtobacterium sp. 20TX0008 TaxID=3022018 RepID=UPI00232B2285|nr:hypothetical protein [Curtobacterium sp. 20TX0008]MDB6425898.1 hypothetical protein [Curtobacterium sp. 20TX0008]